MNRVYIKRIIKPWLPLFLLVIATGCRPAAPADEAPAEEAQTPVTVTKISRETMAEYVDLNAMSSFLQSSFIKATANGYVKSVNVKPGQFVRRGQLVFMMQTKEARALGNTINVLDSSFRFSGIIRIYANQTGYITSLDHQEGDYVQDGEQMAVLSDASSFGFLLNLPYELRPFLLSNKTVDVELPDKTHLQGRIAQVMPVVDSVSQTQPVLIKVAAGMQSIPQNLIGKIRIMKTVQEGMASLPKEAVLSDESQTNFWVMKLTNSVTAVRVPVKKGLETKDRIQIQSPVFTDSDLIVVNGNYGLGDTARIKIVTE